MLKIISRIGKLKKFSWSLKCVFLLGKLFLWSSLMMFLFCANVPRDSWKFYCIGSQERQRANYLLFILWHIRTRMWSLLPKICWCARMCVTYTLESAFDYEGLNTASCVRTQELMEEKLFTFTLFYFMRLSPLVLIALNFGEEIFLLIAL